MSDHFVRTVPPPDSPTPGTPPAGITPDADAAIPSPPGYELLDEVGRGGMGVVYRARDLALSRDVAVKVLRGGFPPGSAAPRRFLDEAFITGQLQHPGIPAVHQVGTSPDGRPFLAMKLIKGRTLDRLLKERPDPSADRGRLLAVFEQVCQAVGYAHVHRVIHRDLKPVNVMVGSFGEVQVMDWGLAKVLASGAACPRRPGADPDATLDTEIRSTRGEDAATQAGSLLGTPAFMPPEQAIGAVDQVDERSDVFSLGAILCVVLTGKPPYVGADAESTRQLAARAKLEDAFARLDGSGTEPELVALCKRCLAAEKAARPADAGEVAAAVAGLRADAEDRARQAELDRARAEVQAAEQRKRRRVQLALASAVLLLLSGGGTFAWWADRQATARRVETESQERDERERWTRNADAVASLLGQCDEALRADDPAKAALALEAAEQRMPEGGAEHLTGRLARCRADLTLLRALDRVDALRWTWVEGRQVPPDRVKEGWAAAFSSWGFVPGTNPAAEAARRVNESSIRERVLAALDEWLTYSRSSGLRALLRAADADEFRDAVRGAVAARDGARVAELAGRPNALDQPARFAAVLGEQGAVAVSRRKQILGVALQRRPGDFSLLMTRGSLGSSTAAEREAWFRAAVAVRPRNAVAHQSLAHALRAKGDLAGAVAAYKEMIRLDPKLTYAHDFLVDTLAARGDLDGAVAYYKEAVRLHPKDAWAYTGLGNALGARGDFDGAVAAYKEAVGFDPTDAIARQRLGDALYHNGDRDGAVAAYKESIRVDPQYAPVYNSLGDALQAKGDFDGAIALYKEAIRLDPAGRMVGLYAGGYHANLGDALRAKGDLDGAVAAFKAALRTDPKSAPVSSERASVRCRWINHLGSTLMLKGDVNGALAAYKEALRLDPTERLLGPYAGEVHANLGAALRAKGDIAGAVAAFKAALQFEPKFAPVSSERARARCWWTNELGNTLMLKGDVNGALAAYKEAVQLNPKFTWAHNGLGDALVAKGDLDRAIAEFRAALRLDPKNAVAQANLDRTLKRKAGRDAKQEPAPPPPKVRR